jgi:hypothetical protein
MSAFFSVWPLVGGETTERQAVAEPAPLLRRRATDAVRDFLRRRG